MTKIKSIEVLNFKAIKGEQKIDLNGASAIVTAGNNSGKTSLLRGLIDRFRGHKPALIVNEGEEKGKNVMVLTDGSKIQWDFTSKTERISFTTADDIKMTTGVLSAIGYKYFGNEFDIDKFIRSSKTEALKMVQKLVGIDLSDVDKRYNTAYQERGFAKKELDRIIKQDIKKPKEPEETLNLDELKKEKENIRLENDKINEEWSKANEAERLSINNFNKLQDEIDFNKNTALSHLRFMQDIFTGPLSKFVDFEAAKKYYEEIPSPQEKKIYTTPAPPELKSFSEIDSKIEKALSQQSYQGELNRYNTWVESGKKAREDYNKLDNKVKSIKKEKEDMIKNSTLPEGFEFSEDGLLYNGFVVDGNQISSSSKYICALKLGALSLGKIRAMHFDCSFLDRNSLEEILDWAESNDLQLLIERPNFEGGEIEYNIVNKNHGE